MNRVRHRKELETQHFMSDLDRTSDEVPLPVEPIQELGNAAPDPSDIVRDVVQQLTGPNRPPEVNAATTFERSELFWSAINPAKRELVARVMRDRALDASECPTTLAGVIEAYAEARLFRMSMFIRLTEGDTPGPITGKGKTKALYLAYVQALDRETKLAQVIGLDRASKQVDLAQAFASQERSR
jgi:hypothetical protein